MSPGGRVLVCDDEHQILRALRVILRDGGFDVTTAATAQEALDRATVGPVDAAIIDLVLPDGDGVEVCRSIREWSDMPIIVLTCSDEIRDVNMAYALGANSFLTKPVEFTEFKNTLYAAYTFWVKDRPVPPSVAGASEEVRPES